MTHSLDAALFQRLQARAGIINKASSDELPLLEYLFAQAGYLGKLLHSARQLLESPRSSASDVPVLPPEETLWLWEQGLALPDEVRTGQVSAVVRHYVDHLNRQRHHDVAYMLKQDIVSLYFALKEGTPSNSLAFSEQREEA